jgi:hypothetical protein
MAERRYCCAWCGEDLGVFDRRYHCRDDTCGNKTFARLRREQAQAAKHAAALAQSSAQQSADDTARVQAEFAKRRVVRAVK